jgi:hypothetical protein
MEIMPHIQSAEDELRGNDATKQAIASGRIYQTVGTA